MKILLYKKTMILFKRKYFARICVIACVCCCIVAYTISYAENRIHRERQSRSYDLAIDSIVMMLSDGHLHEDSLLLIKAIELSDRILSDSENLTQDQKFRCYYHRTLLFATLGRMDEAYENREKTVLCMNENNPERLLYYGYKYRTIDNQDSSKFYLDKLEAVCDKLLAEEFNPNVVFYKVQAIFLSRGEAEAKKYLKDMCKEHPKDELLLDFNNNWDAWMEGYLTNRVVDLSSF